MKPTALLRLAAAIALAAPISMSSKAMAQAKAGLDSIDNNRTREALAAYGLTDLLTRSFDQDNVPQAERDSFNSVLALNQLVGQDPSKLTAKQRKEIVSKLTGGVDKAVAGIHDPKQLSNLAAKLYTIGVANDASLLEYWGDDPAIQARLLPAANAVVALYAKSESAANDQINTLTNQITSPDDPKLKTVTDLTTMATTIGYTKESAQYFIALAMDKADPKRKDTCKETIEFLKQYDDPSSSIQPTIRVQTGKLQMLSSDFTAALATFKTVYADTGQIQPKPAAGDVNDARTFSVIADILAGQPDAAEKMLNDTNTWQKASFNQPAVFDADEVLKARIAWLRAEKSNSPSEQARFNDQASQTLTALMKARPELKSLILEQLVKRLPPKPDLAKLDPLLLQAMVQTGRVEYAKDAKEPFDKVALQKGIDAAQELIKRSGQPGVDPDAVEQARLVIPFFAQKLDQPKVAAAGFLDYAQHQQGNPQKAADALNQAMTIILGSLHAPNVDDANVTALYDKAVPLAINPPFNHKELAYAWARRQQSLAGADESKSLQRTNEAIQYFKLVPADSPQAVNAAYWMTVALNTKLDKDTTLGAAQKTQVLNDLQTQSAKAVDLAKAAMTKTPTPQQQKMYQQIIVRTPLLAAGIAQEQQKNPHLALKLLDGYEQTVQGLPNADQLLSDALQTRVFSYMDLGQNKQATDALVSLLQKRGANEGIKVVYDLLQRLNKSIDDAYAKNDMAEVKALAPNRAVLTGFLAKWAVENKDPKIQALAYGYQAFDADSKRLAASFESDPAKRKAALDQTMKAYDALLAQPKGASDPNVQFGAALTYYDLGNYEKSRDGLLQLLRDRRLGQARREVSVNGQTEMQDNDLYWEARLKLLRSNLGIATANKDDSLKMQVAGELRLIYTQFGKNTGGQKWGPEFEKLRKEVDPTINPDESILPGHPTDGADDRAGVSGASCAY